MAAPTASPSRPTRRRHGHALGVALPGVLLAFLPGVGLGLALVAIVLWTRAHHRRRPASALALALAIFGAILGGLFTFLYLALPVTSNRTAHEVRWLSFDRLFLPGAGKGGTGGEMP